MRVQLWQEEKSEHLDDMMEKSKDNLLTQDGLSTLNYKKLNEKQNPLYTWYLVKIPKPPRFPPKSMWKQAKESLWGGMNLLGGGIAKTISDKVEKVAEKKEEEEEEQINHIY